MAKFLSVLVLSLAWIGPMVSQGQQQGDAESRDSVTVAKAFFELLTREDFAKAVEQYDAMMKTALPQDKLRETWAGLISQVGKFKRQVSTSAGTQGGYEIVTFTCEFEKTPLNVKVVLDQSKHVAGLFFEPVQPEYSAPSYVKPAMFTEQEVTIGTGEWALSGTLSIPKDQKKLPAVVLVHGSGPHDRDESIGPNKTFRDLAWGLATQGVAVLRYNKRTLQHGAKFGTVKRFTVNEESIEDALAAVQLLRKQPSIASDRIFVLGHSLGGTLVPRVGLRDPSIAGFIVMAGTASPIEELILAQLKYIFGLDGTLSKEEQDQLLETEKQIASVKSLKPTDIDSEIPVLGVPASYWLDLRGYNAPVVAKGLKQPMLILQGERDYQVAMDEFQKWKNALMSRKNVTFKSYPQLNHLFIEGSGKSVPGEYSLAGHVAEPVITDIANWIKKTL